MRLNRNTLVIAGIVVVVILIVLSALLLKPSQSNDKNSISVTYTDRITGESRDAVPYGQGKLEGGDLVNVEPGLIAISGIQDFYSTLTTEQSESINKDITIFVRAHGGTGSNEASVVGTKIDKASSNPFTYSFELVTRRPEAKYQVKIVMPGNQIIAPIVEMTQEAL